MPATLALRIEIGRRDASGEADGARLIGVEDAGREPKAARGRTSVRNDARADNLELEGGIRPPTPTGLTFGNEGVGPAPAAPVRPARQPGEQLAGGLVRGEG
jgi:hypothetical protein